MARSSDQSGRPAAKTKPKSSTKPEKSAASKPSGNRSGWLRSTLDAAPVGCSIADQNGVLKYVNQRLADTFGTTRTKLLKKSVRELYWDPADRTAALKMVKRDGCVRDMEVCYRRLDGTPVWTLLSLQPTEFDGKPAMLGWTHEITKRRRAEAAVRENQERYERALEGAGEGLWDWDVETDQIHTSTHFLTLMGLDRNSGTVVPDDCLDCMLPGDREAYRESIVALLRGETETLTTEFRVGEANAGHRWLRASGVALRDDDGRVCRVAGSLADITERKAQDELLEWKSNLLRLLTLTAQFANKAESLEEAIQFCLDTVCTHTGWPVGHAYIRGTDDPKRLIPSDLWHFAAPKRFEKFRRATARSTFGRGEGLPGRVWKSGQPAWITDVTQDPDFPRARFASDVGVRAGLAIPVHDETDVLAVLEFFAVEALEPDEQLLGMLTQIGLQLGDLAARLRVQNELKESEQEFRRIFDAANEGIWMVDNETRTIRVNDALCGILGRNREEILGRRSSEFFDTANKKILREQLKRREQGEAGAYEMAVLRPDGSQVSCLFNSAPTLDDNGEKIGSFSMVSDISARKQAEERQAQLTAQLDTVLSNVIQGVAMFDSAQELAVWNQPYEDVLGVPRSMLRKGVPLYDLARWLADNGWYGVGDADKQAAERVAYLWDGQEGRGEITTGDGRVFDVLKRPTPDGGLVLTYTDITERKLAEEELRESEARFREMLESSPMAVGIGRQADARVMFANARFREMFRIEPDAVIGSDARGRYARPEDRDAVLEVIAKHGFAHDVEIEMKRADGTTFWALMALLPTEYQGEPGYLGWYYDIDERRKAQERFRALLESAPDATVIVNEDGEIVQSNQQTKKLFGYTSDELTGQKVEVLLPEHVRKQHPLHRNQFFEDARVRPMGVGLELFGQTKDGREFPIEISLSPIETDQGLLVSAAVRDITERRKAEIELRIAKEQAEAALADLTKAQARLVTTEKMASLGQLTAGIAHEIKNPLNFVNNFSETSVELLDELKEVLEPVQGQLDDETRDDVEDVFETLKGDLQKIHHHGGRADSIVKSMLLHARGDTSERVATSVNVLVEEALHLAYHGERARDKSFQVTLDENFDDAAGDAELVPQEITRALVNLFSNAFYAVKKRSEAQGADGYEPTVSVHSAERDGNVEIRVRDNGTGMPKEVREKLFEPFFTTKPTGEGTGLGLSMCFDIIVQQHGGKIDVDSEPGSFTEFVITLPRRAAGTREAT